MTWQELQTTLIGLAVSAIVGLLSKWIGLKRAEETRSAVTWAVEQGVAYAAHKLGGASGEAKKNEAVKIAESLAPKAMGRLEPEQKYVLADSVYARMKTSLPSPSLHRTDPADIPVDVVESRR